MTRAIPSQRHQAALPALDRVGFAAALHRHTSVRLGRQGRLIPDAFHFDQNRSVLTLYEVEVTHFISEDAAKLDKLRLLRDVLPSFGWRLRVRLAASDGVYRPMDWQTGQPKIPRAVLRRAIDAIGRQQ